MLPAYNLVVDITAMEKDISEMIFREQTAQYLSYLEALKGSFDRSPCSITYYSPSDQHGKSEYWSVRIVVLISIGKQRAEHLMNLYKAIVRLSELELPNFRVESEISVFHFS